MKTTMLSFAVPLFTALVLVTGPSIAQDKGKTAAAELTSQSRAALARLDATLRWPRRWSPRRTPFWYFPRSPKPGLASVVSTEREPSSRRERRPPTTRRPALRSASRLAGSNTATPCSS